MDVSIVVLTWEDFERTTACVKSLPAGAEVVVVDNGSSPAVGDALRDLCSITGAVYVPAPSNLGYAKGMNLGVRHCARTTVVLSNNDLIAEPGAVERLIAALDDDGVGVAFPSVRRPDGSPATEAGHFLTLPVGLAHLTGLGALVPALRLTAPPTRADWLTGPFVAIRRETLHRVGGVDESAFFYSEDLRLCWAVRRLGLRIAYVPDSVVMHESSASANRLWDRTETARRQTRELIRASLDQGGWRRRAACRAYAAGTVVRAIVGPDPVRKAIAEGARQGMLRR
jgi:GT2 family glycosyltransferase